MHIMIGPMIKIIQPIININLFQFETIDLLNRAKELETMKDDIPIKISINKLISFNDNCVK